MTRRNDRSVRSVDDATVDADPHEDGRPSIGSSSRDDGGSSAVTRLFSRRWTIRAARKGLTVRF